MPITHLTHFCRSEGDPQVLKTGPSSLTRADELARALGWFSVGLGVTEILATEQIARMLGLEGPQRGHAVGARRLWSDRQVPDGRHHEQGHDGAQRPAARTGLHGPAASPRPAGRAQSAYLATHRFSLEDGPRGYDMFKHNTDGCVRAVFAP